MSYNNTASCFNGKKGQIKNGPGEQPSSNILADTGPQLEALMTVIPADEFPDGGLEAWSVVLGAWCSNFVSFGWVACMGVFQAYYQTHKLHHRSPSSIAWILSTESFALFACAPVFGHIFDNYGARALLVGGAAFHVFGLMMVSLSKEYYQILLAQGVCSAVGASAVYWACSNAVGTGWLRRRGLAMGIASSGSSVGGIVGTAAIPALFDKIGFAWTMRAAAFVYLFLLSISITTVKSRLAHKSVKFQALDLVRPLKEKPVLLVAVGCFFFFLGVLLPDNFIPIEAMDAGMSSSRANSLLVIFCAATTIGRIVPGWAGDRFGIFNVTIAFTYLSTLLVFVLWIPAKSDPSRMAFAGLYGFSSALVSAIPTLAAQVCSNIDKLGAYMGAIYIVLSPAILMGQPIVGALLGASGSGNYLYLKIFAGLMMFIGGGVFIFARFAFDGGEKGIWI
ncbi:uncharacterized protein BP5553_02445 [Venustampulla echinocandica]|uniref:Major facilitator superfamily (MFS) profile domain-containing protein n=1 Tax=Venustampulla echinocandica TaxID=2656787 RepID=A0A370U3W5_9HELO|nr:uncharacterized protein BP5553_02445 [Venustampulla echinocandica]RDL42466.1 hypothetical protein BP5553_02445 [Venustampulla echinocandica]